MAGDAAFVVGTAMAPVAAGRIELAFNLVQRHEVPAMRHFTIGAIAIFNGWLHFNLVGMAIVTERAFMAGGT